MKRFVWRLQRVLQVKAKEEQIKTAQLLKITEELTEKRGKLLRQKRILRDIIDDLSSENAKKRLKKQEFFLKSSGTADELIKKIKKQIITMELKQKEKIAEVIKIKRFKEGLEKLREETKKEFIYEQEKLEQKELDDGATIVFARKKLLVDS